MAHSESTPLADDVKIPNPYDDYPPHWVVLDRLGPRHYGVTGFKRDLPFARRFGARYRFARSVKEIVLDGYSSADTRAGYSALTRLALTYSAFESMLALIGVSRKNAGTILTPYPIAKWVKDLTAFDPPCSLFRFVESRTHPKHEKAHLLRFLEGKNCDVTAIAAAMRHTFFHGELTPNAKDVDPKCVCRVCEYMILLLVGVMDREIESHLRPLDIRTLPQDEIDLPF